jgi:hypothetical protein
MSIVGNYLACHLWDNADNNIFNECTITSPAVSPGINQPLSVSFSVSASKRDPFYAYVQVASGNDNNKVIGCTLIGGYNALSFVGTTFPGSPVDDGNQAINCTMRDGLVRQAYSALQTNTKISNCLLERPNTFPQSHGFHGIDVSDNTFGVFEKNTIRNAFTATTSSNSASYAIRVDGTNSGNNKIINNLIYNMNANTSELYGIFTGQSNNNTILHNTIVLDNQNGISGNTHGIFTYGNANNVIKNNLIYLARTGTGENIGLNYGSTLGKSSNNNNIYVNSSTGTNSIGKVSTTSYATLADWKAIPFAGFDSSSVSMDPIFASTTDFKPTNMLMNNKGGAGLGVLTDILGVTRRAVPDVGAIEFSADVPTMSLKVFLNEVANGLMSDYLPTLSGSFPLSDPYSAAPFNANYTHVANGATQVTTAAVLTANNGTGNDITDWVFLELRTAAGVVVTTQSALIQRDGDIVNAINGTSEVEFPNAPTGDYQIVIRHRNHLAFRPENLVTIGINSSPTLNLTNNSVAIFGVSSLTNPVGSPTIWTMRAGDANSDGSIDAIDSAIWEPQNGSFDNYGDNADYNLDGSVDGIDSALWELNNGAYEQL